MNTDGILTKLLEGWIDDTLSQDEQSALLAELDANPELRQRFAEQVAMLGAIQAAANEQPRWLALFDLLDRKSLAESQTIPFEAATMAKIRAGSLRSAARHSSASGRWAVAAALALLLTGSFFLVKWDGTKKVAAHRIENAPLLGTIVGASPDAPMVVGNPIHAGMISQPSGWLTMETSTGAIVTFDAPFEAHLENTQHIQLKHGRVRVRVTEGARGFKVETPGFQIIDLGTEFAVNLNAVGLGTCRVFDGEVEVSRPSEAGGGGQRMILVSGKSLRIDPASKAMRMVDELDSDHPPIKLAPREKLQLPTTYESDVLSMKPAGYWRFENITSNQEVVSHCKNRRALLAVGTATIEEEAGGNHSGALVRRQPRDYFQLNPLEKDKYFAGDFSISLFAQIESLQNFTLLSAMRYDDQRKGYSLRWQSYAPTRQDPSRKSLLLMGLIDPPSWNPGAELTGYTDVRPGHWHHFAACRKSGEVILYVDGVEVARQFIGTMALDWRNLFIGRLNGNDQQSDLEARKLIGHIDELAIFTRCLSRAEIQKLNNRVSQSQR